MRERCIQIDMETYDELLARLVSLREKAGYTQKDVARICGVVQGTVGNWESKRSRVPWNHALHLLDHYGESLVIVSRGEAIAIEAHGVLREMEDDARVVAARVVRQLGGLDEDALLDVLAIVERLARVNDKAQAHLA